MALSMCPDHCGTRWDSWFRSFLCHISATCLVFMRSVYFFKFHIRMTCLRDEQTVQCVHYQQRQDKHVWTLRIRISEQYFERLSACENPVLQDKTNMCERCESEFLSNILSDSLPAKILSCNDCSNNNNNNQCLGSRLPFETRSQACWSVGRRQRNQLFISASLRFDSAVQCHLTAWLFCGGGGGVRFIPAWFLYFFTLHSVIFSFLRNWVPGSKK